MRQITDDCGRIAVHVGPNVVDHRRLLLVQLTKVKKEPAGT
jgi:hypothetical protein